ncbi:lysophospholipase L1-like esterase [Cellulosimicrobium cellulans]|jgi:lysophospholipase L1-like esterase|uniref:GDSL-type esterase/lipase family protein n=1 Tax=Cellulosimicrobium cellulans TaxID=1710 RepID=UPI00195970A3|nr:GDSL-type esterase/lipase family protein [Cellulosimicrobium cellulans]MBM7820015.1 lysophospholipase L1-like esterase [Cellulosimicrobium cellulans]
MPHTHTPPDRTTRAPRRARRALLAALTTLGLALTGLGTASAADAPGPDDAGWFTSWAQSQQRVSTKNFDDQSMRMVTRLSQGGDAVRIRLQNQYGVGPVVIDQTSLALSAGGPAIVAGTDRVLTFGGAESVTIPVGGEVWSDPTSIATDDLDEVAVTFYLARPTVASLHDRAGRNNYGAPTGSGNRNAEVSGASFTENLPWTYFVSAVDVYDADVAGTIVAYGSSVVDGVGSESCGPGCDAFGQDRRWTDDLARRVAAELPPSQQVAIVNEGISGTTSSPACGGGGNDGVSRLERDVLALHGVTGVIFYYGTNDLANGCTDATILASYEQIFERLRAEGIRVFVTPVTPRPGYTALQNQYRRAVNDVVRAGGDCDGSCDGVLDFDAVLQDPANPDSIYPPYDTGDGVHANVAGQQAIADSIPLDLLVGDRPSVATDVRLRCLAGTPYVAVRVANTDDVALDVDVATAYGSRSFTGVEPGSSAYQSFAVRTTPSAGVVTVTARTAGGGGTERVERVEHAAPAC